MVKKTTAGRKQKTTSIVFPREILEMLPPVARYMATLDEGLLTVDLSKIVRFCVEYTFQSISKKKGA